MNDIRFATKKDIATLKKIWKVCFGDSDSFIDYYFGEEFQADKVLLLENEEIASMLTIIPVQLSVPDDIKYTGAMLYAVATHPKFQRRGLSTKLMDYAKSYLEEQEVDVITLVPATSSLTEFYAKQGFLNGFYHREIIFSHEQLKEYNTLSDSTLTLQAASPLEYQQVRERFLSDSLYQSYTIDGIAYQKRISLLSLCDIYLVCTQHLIGCVIIEKSDENHIFVKELLVPEKYIMSAMKSVFCLFPSKQYTLRLPSNMGGDIGGTIKPFGMYQFIGSNVPVDEMNGYLGIAYD